tara:strand:+ start:5185 stop:5622 length:438 start_codon:yes stop_codon:yes gene_type:complete
MSTLKVTTVQTSAAGAVTLTKQEATKQWVSYDGVNNAIEGSLNVTSVTDLATGEYNVVLTNAFSSAHDKCTFATPYNSVDDGSDAYSGPTRSGVNAVIGTLSSSTITGLVTNSIQVGTAYGSTSGSNGAASDLSKVWVSAIGDLA